MFSQSIHNRLTQISISSMKTYNRALKNYKPNPVYIKRESPTDLFNMALKNCKVSQTQDWENIQQFILNHDLNKRRLFSTHNIDGLLMASMSRMNRLDLAQSYVKYLKTKERNLNLATVGAYLNLLYNNYKEKMSQTEEKQILKICDDVMKNNSILDSNTLGSLALAFSLTKNWKKCFDLMEEIKKTSTVSGVLYSALIAAAFRNKEEKLAWDLANETLSNHKSLLSITFISYLKTLKRQRKKETIGRSLEKLFNFFEESKIHCNEDVIDHITSSFNLGNKTTVKFSGHCCCCHKNLSKIELTDEEFLELKTVFFNNAIIGKDIFIKTHPTEMRKFQEFIANAKKYDVVLDGLNIAYSQGIQRPQEQSRILRAVISHFTNQNKSVLVLGRVHMEKWPRENWNFVKQNADVFLTQNISQDDPYLLYCGLNSGKNTVIVTRDLMRSHKFLLKERKYKVLFDSWLSQRQYFLLNVNNQGRVFFRIPPHFSAVAQKTESVWHIPYVPQTNHEVVNETFHKTWLCLDCQSGL